MIGILLSRKPLTDPVHPRPVEKRPTLPARRRESPCSYCLGLRPGLQSHNRRWQRLTLPSEELVIRKLLFKKRVEERTPRSGAGLESGELEYTRTGDKR